MSLILSGPKRIYVLLLFWQRLAEPCAVCPLSLARMGQVLGAEDSREDGNGCSPFCRIVMAWRISRIFWRRLIGLSLLVLEPERVTDRQERTLDHEMAASGAERGDDFS